MRILLAWPTYHPDVSAGAVRGAAFARHLSGLGNEVVVLTPLQSHGNGLHAEDSSKIHRILSYDTISQRFGFVPALAAFPITFGAIREAVIKASPDVVIASTPGPLLALETYLATRGLPTSFVLDLRDPWRSGSYLYRGALRNWTKQAIEELLCRKSDSILCVTSSLREMVMRDYGVGPDKVAVVSNGAEGESQRGVWAEKEYDFVFLGAPSAYKNIEELLEALAIVSQNLPIKVRFVGWIENPYTEALETLVRSLGLEESVEFLPRIPTDEVAGVISKARVALETVGGPSTFSWAIGAKNYQYLAAGLPIACLSKHRGGEMYSFLTPDVGFISNTKEDFATSLTEILEDTNRLNQMSSNALKYSEKFRWGRIVSDLYENRLLKLVGERS